MLISFFFISHVQLTKVTLAWSGHSVYVESVEWEKFRRLPNLRKISESFDTLHTSLCNRNFRGSNGHLRNLQNFSASKRFMYTVHRLSITIITKYVYEPGKFSLPSHHNYLINVNLVWSVFVELPNISSL